jgi:hypothetical protein
MNIPDALTIPLGIPAYLVADQLRRGVSPASILASEDSLLAEYRNAFGYAYRWGNIIEARTGAWLAWHFAPVELWEATEALRRAPEHGAPELIRVLQPELAGTLRGRLPMELMLVGVHPQSRRYPHVLFSLVLVDSDRQRGARQWIAAVFLPGVLPEVLERARVQLVQACRTDAGTH